MSRKRCFIKISGDMLRDDVFQWIKKLSQKFYVVVCVGGGTQISKAFKEAKLPLGEFRELGREVKSFEQRQLARNVLEKNQEKVQDCLDKIGARVIVEIPVLNIGGVLCHVNGDKYVFTAYHGFNVLCVVTTHQRVAQKKEYFAKLRKVKVVGF